MPERKSGAWHDLPDRWRRTNQRVTGNREAVEEANADRLVFRGGRKCPAGCGSYIAYQVDLPPKDSVKRHTSNPKACLKHPSHKRK